MTITEGSTPVLIYGGFWRRFAARLIDVLLLLIPTIILSAIIPVLAGVILGLLYWPIFDSSAIQGTPGKFFMGLVVTDEQGRRVTFNRALIRYFLSWVSGLMLCVGYLFNLFTPKRQTFHDIFAGTLVVRREQLEDVDWWVVWRNQFSTAMRGIQGKLDSAAGGSAGAEPGASSRAMEDIEKLHELYRKGALSEAEFEAKKAEILSRI